MDKCQRCLKNIISFKCKECTSFNNLCIRCDNIVHNIPSKQNHRRTLINQQPIQNKDNKDDINDLKMIIYCR